MIVWLGKPLVLAIHQRQIAEHGGGAGLRDETLLDSALARLQQLFAYGSSPPDLAGLAASLGHGLVRNHAFVDGNKRIAHVAYRVFVKLNGGDVVASDEAKYVTMLALAEGALTEEAFGVWLRTHIVMAPRGRVQEPRVPYGTR